VEAREKKGPDESFHILLGPLFNGAKREKKGKKGRGGGMA